jgi:hypothetical protein
MLVVGFVSSVISAITGHRWSIPGSCTHTPQTWSETISSASVFAGFMAAGSYALQLILGKRGELLFSCNSVVICNRCHRFKNRNADQVCKCGGTFEDAENWTWLDDEHAVRDGTEVRNTSNGDSHEL